MARLARGRGRDGRRGGAAGEPSFPLLMPPPPKRVGARSIGAAPRAPWWRRAAPVLLALALVAAAAAVARSLTTGDGGGDDDLTTAGAPAAEPGPGPVVRLSGDDRTGVAVAASLEGFPEGGAGAVVLTRADDYADALAGAPLAAAERAPVLFSPSDGLDERTEREVRRVLPPGRPVYLLGGVGALGTAVEDRLGELGYEVVRYAGPDRYATAVAVAQGLGDPPGQVLATADDFADAVVGGVAAASVDGVVLLTDGPNLPAPTRAYLDAHPSDQRFALGGAAGADPRAEAIVGTNRYDTSRRVAERFFPAPRAVGVANGRDVAPGGPGEFAIAWPPLLVGGAHVANRDGPLLLVDPVGIPDGVARYLADRADSVESAYLYGSRAVLPEPVRETVADLIE